jgi:ribosome-binding ATPase YchF (GTP1/OBG family)
MQLLLLFYFLNRMTNIVIIKALTMRKLLHACGLLAFVSLLSFTACQEKDSVDPAVDLSFTSDEFLLADLETLAAPHLKDGCDEKAFSVHATATAKAERQSLSYILPLLNLSARQAAGIREFARDHHRAASVHRGSISMLHEQILMRANDQRKEYVKAYNENKLTREQLEEKLVVLRERVLTELTSNEQKQTHMRALRALRADLMQKIEGVLDRAQLQKWSNWKESLKS